MAGPSAEIHDYGLTEQEIATLAASGIDFHALDPSRKAVVAQVMKRQRDIG